MNDCIYSSDESFSDLEQFEQFGACKNQPCENYLFELFGESSRLTVNEVTAYTLKYLNQVIWY